MKVLDKDFCKLVRLICQGVDEVFDVRSFLECRDYITLQIFDLVSFVIDFLDNHPKIDFLIEIVLVIFGKDI